MGTTTSNVEVTMKFEPVVCRSAKKRWNEYLAKEDKT